MKDSAFSLLLGAPGMSASRQRARGLLMLTISMVALLILLTPTRIVLSQTATTSRISGIVTDPNKAVLPGVEVELTDPSTNLHWKQTTDESGKYVFGTVAPGVYSMTVTKQGFRTTSFASVKVEVSKSYDFDAVLARTIEADATIYPIYLDTEYETIGAGGRSGHEAYVTARKQLQALADQTGAMMFKAERAEDLEGVYQQVAAELHSLYSMAYAPKVVRKDGKWRKIGIAVGLPGAKVRTKRGYFAK